VTHGWSKSGTTTGIIGNVILGGIIGIGVDAANGANQDLRPNPRVIRMEPVGATRATAPGVASADIAKAGQ
jgi:hypothetical protein